MIGDKDGGGGETRNEVRYCEGGPHCFCLVGQIPVGHKSQ